jgi:hypothetical protein
MVIDFLQSKESCAVWLARNRPYTAILRPVLLTEQFLDFEVARG